MFDDIPNITKIGTAPEEIDARLATPVPCDARGLTGTGLPAWTPNGFDRRGDRYVLACDHPDCRRKSDAPLQRLIERGKGDHPLHTFSWRCAVDASHEVRVEVIPAGQV